LIKFRSIVDLQNKLKEVFLQRDTFDEYIEKGIEMVKEYPDMGPTQV
jgi:hypothetical protein